MRELARVGGFGGLFAGQDYALVSHVLVTGAPVRARLDHRSISAATVDGRPDGAPMAANDNRPLTRVEQDSGLGAAHLHVTVIQRASWDNPRSSSGWRLLASGHNVPPTSAIRYKLLSSFTKNKDGNPYQQKIR
jgi:hypothetical protein